jgi:hypothetical protein
MARGLTKTQKSYILALTLPFISSGALTRSFKFCEFHLHCRLRMIGTAMPNPWDYWEDSLSMIKSSLDTLSLHYCCTLPTLVLPTPGIKVNTGSPHFTGG